MLYKKIKYILFLFTLLLSPLICAQENIKVCFTPGGNCAQQIIDEINKAHKQILVQAYGFTNQDISNALIKAKQHGIDVNVLLDKSNLRTKKSVLPSLIAHKINSKIDYLPIIAHNKIIIIDETTVLTGSYNFTEAAEHKNAENMLIINDKNIAGQYINNWIKREKISK